MENGQRDLESSDAGVTRKEVSFRCMPHTPLLAVQEEEGDESADTQPTTPSQESHQLASARKKSAAQRCRHRMQKLGHDLNGLLARPKDATIRKFSMPAVSSATQNRNRQKQLLADMANTKAGITTKNREDDGLKLHPDDDPQRDIRRSHSTSALRLPEAKSPFWKSV